MVCVIVSLALHPMCLHVWHHTPDRVGRIIVVGNTATPDSVILEQLGMSTGAILQYALLRQAEINLGKLGLFDEEEPPAVEVIPNEFDSEFKDIQVRIKEKAWNWLLFCASDGLHGILTGDANTLSDVARRFKQGH